VDAKLAPLFTGCDLILHAGDMVKPAVLEALAAVAPVTAVRGNNDRGPEFARTPETVLVPLEGLTALVVHDLGSRERPKAPARPILQRQDPEIVIHGHSHRPGVKLADGTLFLNPGSAGPRRFSLPRTAAVLSVHGRGVLVAFFDLEGERVKPFGEPLEATL
jgi:uncharacterized protein